MLHNTKDDVPRDVTPIFEGIQASFERICEDKPQESAEESELRVKLSANLVKAKRIMDGDLKHALEECKQWIKPQET